jgi:subtilisin family serine protease
MKKQVVLLSLLLGMVSSAFAQKASHIEGQLLVKVNEGIDFQTVINKKTERSQVNLIQKVELLSAELGYYQLFFDETAIDADDFSSTIQQLEGVEAVQFNHKATPRKTPNDASFSSQWDMRKIQVEQVWDTTTGGATANGDSIVVAVVEVSGFNVNHPDIKANLFRNRNEIPNDGIDNDGNGYIDDIMGWNGTSNSPKVSEDTGGHGTPVMGIIGAKGNNTLGVTGVNWDIRMMLCSDVDDEATSIRAYNYILKMRQLYNQTKGKKGAFVVALNYSAGIENAAASQTPFWCKMFDELGKVGILAVVATSNSTGKDIEKTGDVPTQCPSAHLIGVTNTSSTDAILGACGLVSVDLAAPGGVVTGLTSPIPTGSFTTRGTAGFAQFAGTSAAAPHVAGTIALLYSFPNAEFAKAALDKPSETALFIKDAILKSVDKVPGLATCVATGGRLNAFKSFQFLQNAIDKTEIQSLVLSPNPVRDRLKLEFSTNGGTAPTDIFIYNSIGELVAQPLLKTTLFESQFQLEIDVRTFRSGVYFLGIKDENGKFQTQRFVVL